MRAELDPETLKAVASFMRRIEHKYAPVEALVFGSRARGDHTAASDADVAIILKGAIGDRWTAAGEMAGIAFDVMQETGVLVDPLPLWESELAHPESFSNPALIEHIKCDARRL